MTVDDYDKIKNLSDWRLKMTLTVVKRLRKELSGEMPLNLTHTILVNEIKRRGI